MIITGVSRAQAAYAAATNLYAARQDSAALPANHADRVSISAAAQTMLAASQSADGEAAVARRLAEIKTRPAVERSSEDSAYLDAHDQRFGELKEKVKDVGWNVLNADEVDYMQKAGGFVNTMAELSPKEKALYDELVAQGNHQAAQGLNLVAMARIGMKGQQVTLPNGRSFDPTHTEVTAANVRNLFRQMFVDPSGQTDRQFEALAGYLEGRGAAKAA